MQGNAPSNPLYPLLVPLLLAAGFLYVHWMGYSVDSPEPIPKMLAQLFGLHFGPVFAALVVSGWSVYAAWYHFNRPPLTAEPNDPFKTKMKALANAFPNSSTQVLQALEQATEALASISPQDKESPETAGRLGAWLGEYLCREHQGQWVSQTDPDLGPYAFHASWVQLGSDRVHVFAVAQRALTNPGELEELQAHLDALNPAAAENSLSSTEAP